MRLCSHPRSANSLIILLTVSLTARLLRSWYPSAVSTMSGLLVLVKMKESWRTRSPSLTPSYTLPLFRTIFSCYDNTPTLLACCGGGTMALVLVSWVWLRSFLRASLKREERSAWGRQYLPGCVR